MTPREQAQQRASQESDDAIRQVAAGIGEEVTDEEIAKIRTRAATVEAVYFEKYGRRCEGCGGTSEIHLHHRSYEHFMNERDEDLVGLCSTCHGWVHQLERSQGLSLAAATDAVLAHA